jgi:tricorn protease
MVPSRTIDPVWSPDSRWIAYVKHLDNLLHAVFVYNVETGKINQITDGFSDATSPAWDASGKYLYFFAGTNLGLTTGWLDMTAYDRPTTRGIYMVILKKGEPSPFLPPLGDEAVAAAPQPRPANDSTPAGRGAGAAPAANAERPQGAGRGVARAVRVDIDFDNLAWRTIALPVPERNYSELQAGAEYQVFYSSRRQAVAVVDAAAQAAWWWRQLAATLQRARPRGPRVHERCGVYTISSDRHKLLYRAGQNWGIVDSDRAAPQAGAGRIDVSALRMRVDPKAEYKQMFAEGWRFQRDYLYVENMHGVDYAKTYALYAPLVDHVAHRADFTYLLDQMGGEISIGHSYVRGGDMPKCRTSRLACSAPTSRSQTAAIESQRSYVVKAGTPDCGRHSASQA